jgi:ribonuclease P protein component
VPVWRPKAVGKSLTAGAQKAVKDSVPDFGFGRALHLCDKTSIQTVFESGKKLGSREFSLFFYPNPLSHPRLCVSVSKKQVPKANLRNLIKRSVRESFRLMQKTLPACDIVIVVYKSMLLLDSKEKRGAIDKQWQRLIAASKNL